MICAVWVQAPAGPVRTRIKRPDRRNHGGAPQALAQQTARDER